jgi:peptidoglycan/LPS O-acetylase OafA/YrhL
MSKADTPLPGKIDHGHRVLELDGVRGFALCLVLFWHYGMGQIQADPGSVTYQILDSLRFAWSGVDMFFVLSGFLIGGILLDNREKAGYFQVFYIRRICRIFPLYAVLVLLYAILVYGVPAISGNSAYEWLFSPPFPLWSYATFTQNIFMANAHDFGPKWLGITWTVAVEEQFYILIPLLLYVVPRNRLAFVLLCLIALVPVYRIWLFSWHPHAGMGAYLLMPARADALLMGVLVAYTLRDPKWLDFTYSRTGYRAILALIVVSLLGICLLFFFRRNVYTLAMSSLGYTLFDTLYALLILLMVTGRARPLGWFLRLPVFQKLGAISYGVYLFHQAVAGLLHGYFLGAAPRIDDVTSLMLTLIALGLTIGLAVLSWRYFEKPIVVHGYSYKYGQRKPEAVAPA